MTKYLHWVAGKEHTFVSHSSEAGKSTMKVLADLESGEAPLPRQLLALCPPTVEGGRELPESLSQGHYSRSRGLALMAWSPPEGFTS